MSDILLEVGSNEVEILELILGQQHFGVNVLKIRQILQCDPQAVTPIPGMYHSVLGHFLFHGQSIPLIELKRHFKIEEDHRSNMPLITLVCGFNHILTGFLISGIDRILRILSLKQFICLNNLK